jgi:hypothetical protein
MALSNVALKLASNFAAITTPYNPYQVAVSNDSVIPLSSADVVGTVLSCAGVTFGYYGSAPPALQSQVAHPDWADGSAALELVQQYTNPADITLVHTPQSLAGTVYDIMMRSRDNKANQASKITLKGSVGTDPEPGLHFEVDEQRIINSAKVSMATGDVSYASDATSIAEFGELRAEDVDSLLLNLSDADGFANWLVYLRAQPVIRCDSVSLEPTAGGSTFTALMTLAIGDVVTLDELPTAAPYTTASFFVEQINHKVSVAGETEQWSTTLGLSPADGWGVWVLEDAVHGFIDDANSVIFY